MEDKLSSILEEKFGSKFKRGKSKSTTRSSASNNSHKMNSKFTLKSSRAAK